MPTPHQLVQTQHGSKADLVERVVGLVEPMNGETPEEHKRRLRNVSNAKLLHLVTIGEKAKELGGRKAIIQKILAAKGQSKDHEYADALERRSLGQLIDMMRSSERRAAGKAKKKPQHLRQKA